MQVREPPLVSQGASAQAALSGNAALLTHLIGALNAPLHSPERVQCALPKEPAGLGINNMRQPLPGPEKGSCPKVGLQYAIASQGLQADRYGPSVDNLPIMLTEE